MAKINIVKPTGSDTLSLLSAFKNENLTYVIFDSEKVGSMGLPIIYISKLTDKLEKVTDDNEWQSVKNSLKGIISGTSFEYVSVNDTINADEVYYTPLTLPQSSFDLIKNRYVVPVNNASNVENAQVSTLVDNTPIEAAPSTVKIDNEPKAEEVIPAPNAAEVPTPVSVIPNISPVGPISAPTPAPAQENMSDLINSVAPVQAPQQPVTPVMPSVNAESNASYVSTPNVAPTPAPVPTPPVEPAPIEKTVPVVEEPVAKFDSNVFMQDKETFLRACENMFDALVSKYQKQLDELEKREQSLKSKEQEVQIKLNNANEHLANAEAREQVANIAHDNAQRVMDINNLMPNNPNAS